MIVRIHPVVRRTISLALAAVMVVLGASLRRRSHLRRQLPSIVPAAKPTSSSPI